MSRFFFSFFLTTVYRFLKFLPFLLAIIPLHSITTQFRHLILSFSLILHKFLSLNIFNVIIAFIALNFNMLNKHYLYGFYILLDTTYLFIYHIFLLTYTFHFCKHFS